jgi:hypothetical protein
MAILQEPAEKGQQRAANAPDTDGLDFQHKSSQLTVVSSER